MRHRWLFLLTGASILIFGASSKVNVWSHDLEPTPNARTAAQLYGKYCTSCHGQDGKAQTRKAKYNHARDISDAKWQDEVTDERIYNSIMNGRKVRGNMPAFNKQLSDEEAESLVSFVRAFRK